MTAEELEAILKAMGVNRPQVTQTMNFNAPIGQQIAHVDKIEAHFDKDMRMEIAGAEEVAGKPSSKATPKDDGVTNRDTIIPADCKAAIEKVLVPTYTVNGVVMNSMQQLIKAAALIDLTSNSEVAMLMAVGQEVNAVRPGVRCPDFARALIGMGVIAYSDKVVDKMAGGMTKKLNGYKKDMKTYPPLPANHLHWNSNDLPIGKRLYDAMQTQG